MLRPYNQSKEQPKIDDVTKRLLGVKDSAQIHVMEGQTADADKLRAANEQYLLQEACRFADILVHYIGDRSMYTMGQRAFALNLSIQCLRFEYPERGDKFDEIADQGGEDVVDTAPTTNMAAVDAAADAVEQGLRDTKSEVFIKAAKFAETLTNYVTMKKDQLGISNVQCAYALGRLFHTMRTQFPADAGGVTTFDEYAQIAGRYFERNKNT